MTSSTIDAQVHRAMRQVAEAARLAPSVHNTQPWRFEITPTSFTLLADRTRQLRALDPTGRQMTISLGCALFNARVSAAAQGLPVTVSRFPDGEGVNVVARLEIAQAGAVETDLAPLEPLLLIRSTNRRRFADDPVPQELLDGLQQAATAEDSRLVQVRDEDDRMAVARLSQRADEMQYRDPAYRAELRAWTTADPGRLDGVPARAVPHVDAGSGDEIPIRDFDSTGAGWLPTATGSTRNQCLLLLGSDADSPRSWLRAGEALERIQLEIARHGYAVSPLTQVVEIASTRAALRSELRMTMNPLILMRVGRAPVTPGASRRHLRDILTASRPSDG